MSEATEAKKVEFDHKLFEKKDGGKGTILEYGNEKVFEDSLPISKKEAKEYEHYRGEYITQFVKDAAHVAEGHFKRHSSENEVTVKAPFGMAKSSSVQAHIIKNKERLIPGFNGQEPKTITTSQINLKVTDRLGMPSKSLLKDEGKALHERLMK